MNKRGVYVERGVARCVEIITISSRDTRILHVSVDPDFYTKHLVDFAQGFLDECDPQSRLTLVKSSR